MFAPVDTFKFKILLVTTLRLWVFEVTTARVCVLVVVTFVCWATTKGIVNVSKKKVVFVVFAVKDEGTTKDVELPNCMFEVMRLELTTFIFWKRALLVVIEFAAQILLPDPFRKILDEFIAKIPLGLSEASPPYVSNTIDPPVLLVVSSISCPDFPILYS